MRLEQIQYLLEIEKEKSISAAAEKLFVSPSTISEAIKKMEQELNVILFVRSKTGMQLTEIGKRVLIECKKVEMHLDNIYEIANNEITADETLAGQINLSICFGMGSSFLMKTISDFHRYYPKIALNVSEKSTTQIIYDLYDYECDIALLYCHDTPIFREAANSFFTEKLLAERFVAVAKKNHRIKHYSTVSLQDIAEYPIAIYGMDDIVGNGLTMDNVFLQEQHDYQIAFRSNDMNLFVNYLLESDSVGIVLNGTAYHALNSKELQLIPISDGKDIALQYFYNGESEKISLIDAFLKTLKKNEYIREHYYTKFLD